MEGLEETHKMREGNFGKLSGDAVRGGPVRFASQKIEGKLRGTHEVVGRGGNPGIIEGGSKVLSNELGKGHNVSVLNLGKMLELYLGNMFLGGGRVT